MMRTWIRFDPSRAWRLGSGAWRCSPAPRRARRRPLRSGDRLDGSSRQIGNGPLRAMLPRRRGEPAAGDTRDCPTVARSLPLRSTASARPPRPQAREEAGHDYTHVCGPAPESPADWCFSRKYCAERVAKMCETSHLALVRYPLPLRREGQQNSSIRCQRAARGDHLEPVPPGLPERGQQNLRSVHSICMEATFCHSLIC